MLETVGLQQYRPLFSKTTEFNKSLSIVCLLTSQLLTDVIIIFMNIVVKGKHLTKNQALEDYASKKSEKFSHYFKDIVKVEIELRSEVGRKSKEEEFIADINVKVPGHTFKVTDQEWDCIRQLTARLRE